ncbi:glycosyltransferase [Nodularia harveyana UHCC-0300]|uniref:Glycosyltransferase n=1 Tax=Nodularia harveyana UHCC-0300 TaxID=2974287 RepID=A0ABU5UCI5_9CYAN|nr:glycosyltransferase [Nodularia harveyana]MEA5581254.1 glycosyltransferase [Nodularia harveyana UHCC-0300]
MRIIHLSKYYPPDRGGIETHIQTLARTQAAMGAEVNVICVNRFDKRGNLSTRTKTVYEKDGDVKVTRVGRLLSVSGFDVCLGLCRKISKFVNHSNTIFHLHTPNPTMLLPFTMLDKKVPLVITHHSDVIKQKILKYALRPFEQLVYSRSSQILTDSYQYIEGSKFLQQYRPKLNVLPLGLDIATFTHPNQTALAYSRSFKEKYGEIIWLAIGRLVYYKALHIAIEALTKVPGKLVVVGVGPLEAELKALAQKLGVEERIVWLGRVNEDELVGAYHAATALWFPSNVRSEGFGLVQVEAMASSCPVINANIPCSGVPWVSRNEQEGLTVPINDPVALAEAAKRLLVEPGLRNRLVRGSLIRAQYFNHINMAERSLELYDKVLSPDFNYRTIPKTVDSL